MSLLPPRRQHPIWIASPGRWSRVDRGRARLALALGLVALVLATLSSGGVPDPVDGSTGLALLDAVRHGTGFYAALSDVGGGAGAIAPGWSTPLPTLTVIEAGLPYWLVSGAMMLLAVAVVIAWYARFGGVLMTRTARTAALLLVLVGMAVALRLQMLAVPEGWAGLLVALSLARRTPGRVVEPAALGLAAMALTCAALPFAAVMAVAAGRERAWRESVAWTIVVVTGLVLATLHGHALALASPFLGVSVPVGAPAPGPALATLADATGLRPVPVRVARLLVVLATLGWASRREPVGMQVAALIVAQAIIGPLFGQPAAALVAAPLLPLGLIAMPDAIRDLAAAALDRRRITVTRIAQRGLAR